MQCFFFEMFQCIFSFVFLQLSYGSSSVEEIEIGKFCVRSTYRRRRWRPADCSPLCAEAGQLAAPAFRAAPAAEELPPNSSVSSVSSCEPPSFESGPFALSVSTPTRNAEPGLLIQSSPNFDSDIIDDDLDDLLDSAGPESPMVCELGSFFCQIHIRFLEI